MYRYSIGNRTSKHYPRQSDAMLAAYRACREHNAPVALIQVYRNGQWITLEIYRSYRTGGSIR